MAKKRNYPENILHDVNVEGATIEDLDFGCLTMREEAVIRMTYIENKMTQKAIANEFEVTELRLRQIVSKALRKLRKRVQKKMERQQDKKY